ncbi:Voltage-Dependent L-Type Calcium Channel Subunit Alpha-1F [Manis pentadactyla]|nr:Voltage-Dependent L-Type Calcium Channel Subunit Alpha-1F [Manis pentadactyla]
MEAPKTDTAENSWLRSFGDLGQEPMMQGCSCSGDFISLGNWLPALACLFPSAGCAIMVTVCCIQSELRFLRWGETLLKTQ